MPLFIAGLCVRAVQGWGYRTLWCEDSTLSFNIKIKVEKVTKAIALNQIWKFPIAAQMFPSFLIPGLIPVQVCPHW